MTITEIKKNPVKVGDFVKVCRGGDQHSRNLIWMVVNVNGGISEYVVDNCHITKVPPVRIKLMSGTFVEYGKEYEVGYERNIRMSSIKKINVVIREEGV